MIRKALAGLLTICAVSISPAVASGSEFEIVPDSLAIKTVDKEGNPDNRAGAHPDRLVIDYGLNVEGTGTAAKDLLFELSPGLASKADAIPRCLREVFDEDKGEGEQERCPRNTQVGLLTQKVRDAAGEVSDIKQPIYNLQPAPSEAATFGAKPLWKVPMTAALRPEDFGLTLAVRDLPQFDVGSGKVELWGIPIDHQEGVTGPRQAFLTTPTRCQRLGVTFRVRSWQPDAQWLSESTESAAPLEGCEGLSFEPKLGFTMSNPVSDSPTGAEIELTMPEDASPDGRASSQLRSMSIELPEGMSISPGGADGVDPCSDEQFALGKGTRASCPPLSRVGSVKVESPELREALTGDLYLGAEHPGERIRILVAASGPGVVVKLAGALRADPVTGRLSVVMGEMPQVPISRMTMSFDGGSHALLATPLNCGSATSTGRFEPYSGSAPVNSSSSTTIGSSPSGGQCPNPTPFAPALVAGSSDAHAGKPTSFSVTMRRQDGEQLLGRFSIALPAGLSAAVGAVGLCPDASAAAGTCPAGSRIGSAVTELGSGASPAQLRGEAYLTEPYRRAPFGLSLVFPARVGPFDLGKLVVRGMLRLDRRTGQVTIETDPLPQIFEGIPTRIRTVGIDMDRPGFMRNPTSCDPTSVNATMRSAGGASAAASTPFSLTACNRLGFKPRFSFAMEGRSELHKGGNPGLSMFGRFARGNTNPQTIKLSFPEELKLNTSNLEELCSHRDAAEGRCTGGSRMGSARVQTPMFSHPLTGGVFAATPEDEGLPDFWLSLSDAGVHVDLRGEVSKAHGHLRMKLVGLPDIPLSRLEMRLRGGENGVLSLNRGLCDHGRARRLFTAVAARGQDGAYREAMVPVRTGAQCGDMNARRTRHKAPLTAPALIDGHMR